LVGQYRDMDFGAIDDIEICRLPIKGQKKVRPR